MGTTSTERKAEKALIRRLRERRLVADSMLESVLAVQDEAAHLGIEKPLAEILVSKHVLERETVDELLREIAREYGHLPQIDGYELYEKIGEGGMGAVYRARQLSMERDVAIKVLAKRLSKNAQYIERFYREARASARLNHPHIVQGIDVGESHGLHYFVMEFVDGATVKELILQDGHMPESQTIQVLMQMCQALHHAWEHGQIHRDVKPDNIMLTRTGQAKLCDLGLAKQIDRLAHQDDAAITRSGTAIGTPHYISPEQARGSHDIDIRADIYSLGATAYHMVTGLTPFEGSSTVVLAKHLTTQCPSAWSMNPELSEGLVYVIEKMMAKEPEDRYQTPPELEHDLERARRHRRVAAAADKHPSTCERLERHPHIWRSKVLKGVDPRKRRLLLIASAAAVLLVALLAWINRERPDPNDPQVMLQSLMEDHLQVHLKQVYIQLREAERLAPEYLPQYRRRLLRNYRLTEEELDQVRKIGVALEWPDRLNPHAEDDPQEEPEVPPMDDPMLERLHAAQEALEEARGLLAREAAGEAHREEAARLLREALRLAGDESEIGEQAHAELQALRQMRRKQKLEVLAAARAKAQALLAQDQYAEAQQALAAIPEAMLDGYVREQVRQSLNALSQQAVGHFQRIRQSAMNQIPDDSYAPQAFSQAREKIRATRAWNVNAVDDAAAQALAELDALEQQALADKARREREAAAARREQLQAEAQRLLDAAHTAAAVKRDPATAERRLQELIDREELRPWHSRARRDLAHVHRLAGLLEQVRANLPRIKGQTLRLEGRQAPHNLTGVLRDWNDQSITIRSLQGGEVVRSLADLTVADLVQLAVRKVDDEDTLTRVRMDAAGVCLLEGDAESARAHLLAIPPDAWNEEFQSLRREAERRAGD